MKKILLTLRGLCLTLATLQAATFKVMNTANNGEALQDEIPDFYVSETTY